MARMKNKNSVPSWARILTLSDNVRGSSAVSFSTHSYFGITSSMSGINMWISLTKPKMLRERYKLLREEAYLAVCYDNNQKWFAKKFQSGGESSHCIKVTTKYAKKIYPYVCPDYFRNNDESNYIIDNYLDPKIRTPPDMPMFLKMSNVSSILSMISDVDMLPTCTESENMNTVGNYFDLLEFT